MRPEGLAFVTTSARALVLRDVGLGTVEVREQIAEILRRGAVKSGTHKSVVDLSIAASLEQLTRRCEKGYIRRWAEVFERGDVSDDKVELCARSLVAHLLDSGLSGDHLHGWLLASRDQNKSLRELLDKADEMCRRDPVIYEVLVPFSSLPHELVVAAGDRHLTWEGMTERLNTRRIPNPPGREGAGALVFTVSAREPKAAIETVQVELRRIAARVVIGLASKTVTPSGHVIVLSGNRPKWAALPPRSADVLVSSITRHGLLLPAARTPATTPLDDAFELLAAVETSTSWASVAAIWAAVEGLLARAGEPGAEAADRMAAIVAGGFVRAELTQLTYAMAQRGDDLGGKLGEDSNLTQVQKLDALLEEIDGGRLNFSERPSDAAAVARINAIIADPASVMERVRGYYRDAFRRLFNQRNLLLHGGRFDSVALPATMRTTPPLVAAGIDRLVHAAMQEQPTSPFGLAARAMNEIDLLGQPGARPVHRLLD